MASDTTKTTTLKGIPLHHLRRFHPNSISPSPTMPLFIRIEQKEEPVDVNSMDDDLISIAQQLSDIDAGSILVRWISGMLECKLGLSDRVLLEAQGRTTKGKTIDLDDIKFHQYVSLLPTFVFLLIFGLPSSSV
uniref:Uncharacterized protein n=1 Tax=Cannabis sativa TaxID=3483 RepID=A0A803Q5F7_CANSA